MFQGKQWVGESVKSASNCEEMPSSPTQYCAQGPGVTETWMEMSLSGTWSGQVSKGAAGAAGGG